MDSFRSGRRPSTGFRRRSNFSGPSDRNSGGSYSNDRGDRGSSGSSWGNSGSSGGGRRFGGNGGGFGGRRGGGGFRRGGFGGGRSRHAAPVVDISQFVRRSQEESKGEKKVHVIKHQSFREFGLSEQLIQNIEVKGFTTPTPIQDQSIEHMMEGRDVIGLANTGTGKTAAFLIPLIEKLLKDSTQHILVIVPVRELADQIFEEWMSLTRNMRLYATLCIGGASIGKQIAQLKRNPHIIIGTPGRLKDLYERGMIPMNKYANVVLDEVDRMFDMGFSEDIRFLLGQLPEQRQSLFFSATMPPEIQRLAETFLQSPVTISVKTQDSAANVDQQVIRVPAFEKFEKLKELMQSEGFDKVLIFTRTKHGTEHLKDQLVAAGVKAESIHGDKTQSRRQSALRAFKENRVQALIATDVAARGLDIKNVSHVINYDKPATYEDYIHRIGRTGRGDKKGVAITFV